MWEEEGSTIVYKPEYRTLQQNIIIINKIIINLSPAMFSWNPKIINHITSFKKKSRDL